MYNNLLFCKHFDNVIRWSENERLDHLFERRCDHLDEGHLAVIAGDATATYREVDRRANQLARYLRRQGVKPGDRVGVMFRQSIETYVSLLAVLKLNAAYVPLDASFPPERLSFIAKDANVEKVVTLSANRARFTGVPVEVVRLDAVSELIDAESRDRLTQSEKGEPRDQLCYIIYTSGSTGNPKGVAIEHPSICNFVRVAAEVYGYRQEDRVYQGMTIAFDFSVEEIWVPLMAGATLVPGTADASLVGNDLADFLFEKNVTALCCVPTLLASLDRDLPSLRLLLLSGEACPHDLVVRWYRPGRTILNAYGPTEATVTATWTELRPDKQVTIGGPLPTYSVIILDERENKVVEQGALGEICIAGIGLAKGYVNRDDLTEKSFIFDFLDIPNNPSKRIYRTGDIGRITDDDEIEYLGRIDTQVKVRGYRIELTEIESVLMEVPQVSQAVVSTHSVSGPPELVAYYTRKPGAPEVSRDDISKVLRARLPGYMIPSYVEELDVIPMLPSNKVDRKKLPAPVGMRFTAGSNEYVAPRSKLEETIADALAEVLELDRVSVEDNFFTDLGAHSLLMAQLASAIKQRRPDINISMRDIYLHSTVANLAGFVDSRSNLHAGKREPVPYYKPGAFAYYGCGFLQLCYFVAFGFFGLLFIVGSLEWLLRSTGYVDIYLRVLGFELAVFVIGAALPIMAKWLLVGRYEKTSFRVWGLRYFVFWMVRDIIGRSPLLIFRDTPIYNVYLRLLGARIGKNALILSKTIPACPDLLTIGDNAILEKETMTQTYRAQSGYIQTGPVTVGSDAFVGEASILDIDTRLENHAQLGHSSALQAGQVVPAGKRFHGCPAEETSANYKLVEPMVCTPLRHVVYTGLQMAGTFFFFFPLILMLFFYVFTKYFGPNASLRVLAGDLYPLSLNIAGVLFLLTVPFFLSGILSQVMRVVAWPRILNLFIERDRTYVIYGFHYYLFNVISSTSNSQFLNNLFGDSSFIIHYLSLIGYDLGKVEQTGSNFGMTQSHDSPFLCKIGERTMVSDGLSMMNAQMSSTSFRLAEVAVAPDNFLGNNIHFPAGATVGANCLLATKVMVPTDGPVRENIGLLGSPPFEIPRTVDRAQNVQRYTDPKVRKERIGLKNIHNVKTMAGFLLVRVIYGYIAFLVFWLAVNYYADYGLLAPALISVAFFPFFVAFFAGLERASFGFRRMKPQACTVLDEPYWRVERYWKLNESPLAMMFKGTPFKNIISRLLGVRLGKRVFDDGCIITEKTMVEIGDYATLNESCTMQSHSLEDGVFKSDYVRIGKGSTLGVNSFVHYGVDMGENVLLDADSFVMKGTKLQPDGIWQGNPAREL
jgi:non-ribosomal peptide synthetase-like protein